jgi:hypothetical protein
VWPVCSRISSCKSVCLSSLTLVCLPNSISCRSVTVCYRPIVTGSDRSASVIISCVVVLQNIDKWK